MISLFSYLITMFAGLFWLGRVVITVCYTLGTDIGITPLNYTVEIILLFVTLICLIFIVKRKIFGALIYFVCYGLYFGDDLYQGILKIIDGQNGFVNYFSLLLSFLGILIPILTVLDIFINKDRTATITSNKTDWFYKNKDFERKHDERADENQYKF